MRLVTVLLLLVLVPAALAQPCDPAQTDEACPDTTTWQRYVPLDVGNIWHYREAFFDEPVTHWSWTVTGETEVGGQTYFELERCDETDDGGATCAAPIPIRYDAEHAMIVRRDGDEDVWWDELPCGMTADFNGEYACTGPGTEGATFAVPFGRYGASVPVPPDTASGDTQKQFNWMFVRDWEVFAGLGVTKFFYEQQGEPTRLVYANVGGQQFGTPAFASCAPADVNPDTICPDTTDWHRYIPLEVGNQWQYHVDRFIQTDFDFGYEVTGEAVIDEEPHYLVRYCRLSDFGTEFTCSDPVPVRYDEENSGRSPPESGRRRQHLVHHVHRPLLPSGRGVQ